LLKFAKTSIFVLTKFLKILFKSRNCCSKSKFREKNFHFFHEISISVKNFRQKLKFRTHDPIFNFDSSLSKNPIGYIYIGRDLVMLLWRIASIWLVTVQRKFSSKTLTEHFPELELKLQYSASQNSTGTEFRDLTGVRPLIHPGVLEIIEFQKV